MDHLPTPRNFGTNQRTIVPYVCRKDYDGGPFLTYPTREGITHALPSNGNPHGDFSYQRHEIAHPTPKHEQEDFLQRWLFFGLIHEILGDRYRPKHTPQTDNGDTPTVSTSGLVEALDEWIKDSRADSGHTYDHIAECLHLTYATIYGAGPDFDLRIKVSLASLGELFALAVNEAYNVDDIKYPALPFCGLIDHVYWEEPMVSSGWCRNQVKVNTNRSMYLQTLYFLRSLGPPASSGIHQSCSNDQCVAYKIDRTTYEAKHVTGCNCKHLSICTKRLTEILKSGSLPLLRIHKGHTLNELWVELVPSESTSCYIALSHVWADGLGNPRANALPRCQLYSLHQLINKYCAKLKSEAVREILLWCDTLCCPVEPEEAKNMALTKMKETYTEAFRVLVLDASIREYDFKTMDVDEACIRILNSGWTRRLWTLQEGALGARKNRLLFQFKDEAINIRHLIGKMYLDSQTSIGRKRLATDIISEISKFNNEHYAMHRDQGEDLGSVEASLRHRSVTVDSDEPLVIANLLDLDVAYILNGPCPLAGCASDPCIHHRIHRMWWLMPNTFRGIPSHVLHRMGPRLSEPGFRWAPSTLLSYESLNPTQIHDKPTTIGPNSVMRDEDPTRGKITSRGLLVRSAGYRLSMAHCKPAILPSAWKLSEQNWLHARSIDGTWFFIGHRAPADQESFLSPKSLRTIHYEESDLWITHVDSDFHRPNRIDRKRGARMGLLVQLLSYEEGIKYVQPRLHVNMSLLQQSEQSLYETAYRSAKEVSRNLPAELLAAKPDSEQNDGNGVRPADDKSALKVLWQEIERIGRKNASEDVIATAEALSKNGGQSYFHTLIAVMIAGSHGYLGGRTADGQEWCFD